MSLKHAILGFLSFSPLSGYDLKKAFDKSVRHFWPANQSQIYRTLAELDEQGMVEKEVVFREDRLDMKIYTITEAGLAELRHWLSTPLPAQENREPFLIQVFFGSQLSDTELLHVLQGELQTVEQKLAAYTAVYETAVLQTPSPTNPRAWFLSTLTLEYGLFANHVYVKWLIHAIERIQTGNYSPLEISELKGETA